MNARPGGRHRVGGIVAALSGALIAIGSFLPWARVSALGFGQSFEGPDLSRAAYLAIFAGVVAIGAGVAIVAARASTIVPALVAALAGLGSAALAVQRIVNVRDDVRDAAVRASAGVTGPADFDRLFDVAPGVGLWLVLGGGLAAIAGAAAGLRTDRRDDAARPGEDAAPG